MRFFSTLIASVLGSFIAVGLVIFVGIMIMTVVVTSSVSINEPSISSESVLVLSLTGPVEEQGTTDPLYDLLDIPQPQGLNRVRAALKSAANDDRIQAVWVKPQGVIAGWSTLLEIRESLEDFKMSGKPLIASSAGDFSMRESDYFLASVADSIFSAPNAFFEFNGFYLGVSFYKGLFDKLNVDPTILKVGSYKGGVEPYSREDMSDENRIQYSEILSNWNNLMTSTVAKARGINQEDVIDLIEMGTIMTTEDAYEHGLLDGLLQTEEIEALLSNLIGSDDDLSTISLAKYSPSAVDQPTNSEGTIGLMTASGTIISGQSNNLNGYLGAGSFQKSMKKFRDDDRVKAVVLRIDSPGGSATASEAMWQSVKETSQKKPVVVSMGDLAASGGYWLATAGDTIIASPHTITGSIGVYGVHFSLGRMLETKFGITSDHVSTSEYADMFSGMRPLRPSEQALFQRSLGDTYEKFLHRVSENRNMSIEDVHEVAQGRVWTGNLAFDAGLVDELGNLDDAIRIASDMAGLEEGSYRVKRLPEPETLLDQYLDLFLAHIRSFIESPIETQFRKEARLLEEAIKLQGIPIARMPINIEYR